MTEKTITFNNQSKNHSVDSCCSLEWLDTNGLGSYSSSTVLNCHSRRYHGLLTCDLASFNDKFVLLSKLDDQLITATNSFSLSASQYLNSPCEGGYHYFNSFNLDSSLAFHYQCDAIKLTKQILMLHGKNTLLIKYTLDKKSLGKNLKISFRPFLAFRSTRCLTKQNPYLNGQATQFTNGVTFTPYQGLPTLTIHSEQNLIYTQQPYWYYNFEYLLEKLNGYDYCEDLFTPGIIELDFAGTDEIILACSIENSLAQDLNNLWQNEITRRITAQSNTTKNSFCARLEQQAEQFVIETPSKNLSIVAGYHWFNQWGRDAMISAPGLTLYSNNKKNCLTILEHFVNNSYQGIIPNQILSNNYVKNEYDTVDSSMWFILALQRYCFETADYASIKLNIWPLLKDIIEHYLNGTLFNIHQLENGLLYAGTPEEKTTWMDVKIDNIPLTPRNGMQVEVNALWYNALCFLFKLAKKFKDPWRHELKQMIKLVKKNYTAVFYDSELGYLRDFVNEMEINHQIRPNQIFAVSLPYSPISKKIARQVMSVVSRELLTPYGLRTLATSDPDYHGVYEGDQTSRDKAYHNGTVWPWLLGAYTDALLKIGSKRNARAQLKPCLAALEKHMIEQAGLGCISEIFDGNAPHQARGCIQQAWSVAELIRLLHKLG